MGRNNTYREPKKRPTFKKKFNLSSKPKPVGPRPKRLFKPTTAKANGLTLLLNNRQIIEVEDQENYPSISAPILCQNCNKAHTSAKTCDGSAVKTDCRICGTSHSIAITCDTASFRKVVFCDLCNRKHKPPPYTCEQFAEYVKLKRLRKKLFNKCASCGIRHRHAGKFCGVEFASYCPKKKCEFCAEYHKEWSEYSKCRIGKSGLDLVDYEKKQEVQKQERLKEKERINKAQAENKDKQFKSGGNKRSAGNNKVSSIKKWKHNRETSQLENNSVQLSDFPDLDKFGLEFSSFGSKRPKFESGLKAQEILEAHNFPQAPSCFNTLNNISNNTSNNQHITVQPTDNLQNWTFLPQENKNPDNSEIIVIDDLDWPVGSPKNVKTPLLSNDNLPPSMPLKVSLLGDKPISEDTDLRQHIEKLRSERESAVNFEGDDKDEYLFASKSTEVEKERTRLADKYDDTRKVNTRNIIGDREDKCPEGVDTELWSSMQAAKNLLDKSAENKQKYGGLKRIVSKTVKCDDIIILDDMIDTNPSRSRSGSNSSRNRSRSPRKSDRNRTSRRSKKRSRSRSKHRSRSRSRSPTRSRSKSRSLHTRKRSKSPKPRSNTSRIRSESPNRSFKNSSRDSPKRKSPTRRSTSPLAGSASYMISRNKNWYPTIITSFRNHYKQQSLQSNIIYLNLMFEKTSNDLSFVSFKSVSPQMLSIHSELFSEILTPDTMNNTEITNFVALPRNLKSDTIVLLMNYVHGFSLELNREINFEDFGFSFSELVISTLYFKLWDLLDDLQNFVLNYKSVRSDLELDFEKVKQYVAVIPKPVFLPGLIEEGQIQFLPQF